MGLDISPKTAGDYGTLIGALVALLAAVITAIAWPFKTFLRIVVANETFVRKVNPDGTRDYVHPSEWAPMAKRLDESIEESKKWRSMAKDWMEMP